MTQYSAYSNVVNGTTWQTETTTLLARVSSAPSVALTNLINTTIAGLKSDGVFTKGDCLYVRGVHESTLALQNWIKNAHNSTLVNSPTFTVKQGFTGDGATNYINNNYFLSTDAVNLSLTSSTVVVMCKTIGTTNARAILGASRNVGVKYFWIYFYTAAGEQTYFNTTTTYTGDNIANNKYLGFAKTGTTVKGYLDGIQTIGDATKVNCASLPNMNVYELCSNTNDAASEFYNGQISFSFYGGYLDSTEMLALYNRIKYFYDNVSGTF
jgi:hypothetical protein